MLPAALAVALALKAKHLLLLEVGLNLHRAECSMRHSIIPHTYRIDLIGLLWRPIASANRAAIITTHEESGAQRAPNIGQKILDNKGRCALSRHQPIHGVRLAQTKQKSAATIEHIGDAASLPLRETTRLAFSDKRIHRVG